MAISELNLGFCPNLTSFQADCKAICSVLTHEKQILPINLNGDNVLFFLEKNAKYLPQIHQNKFSILRKYVKDQSKNNEEWESRIEKIRKASITIASFPSEVRQKIFTYLMVDNSKETRKNIYHLKEALRPSAEEEYLASTYQDVLFLAGQYESQPRPLIECIDPGARGINSVNQLITYLSINEKSVLLDLSEMVITAAQCKRICEKAPFALLKFSFEQRQELSETAFLELLRVGGEQVREVYLNSSDAPELHQMTLNNKKCLIFLNLEANTPDSFLKTLQEESHRYSLWVNLDNFPEENRAEIIGLFPKFSGRLTVATSNLTLIQAHVQHFEGLFFDVDNVNEISEILPLCKHLQTLGLRRKTDYNHYSLPLQQLDLSEFYHLKYLGLRNIVSQNTHLGKSVSHVNFSHCKFPNLNLGEFKTLSEIHLQDVELANYLHSEIRELSTEDDTITEFFIEKFNLLRTLRVQSNRLSRVIIADCPTLSRIDIEGADHPPGQHQVHIVGCPQLKAIKVKGNTFREILTRNCPALRSLFFHETEVVRFAVDSKKFRSYHASQVMGTGANGQRASPKIERVGSLRIYSSKRLTRV